MAGSTKGSRFSNANLLHDHDFPFHWIIRFSHQIDDHQPSPAHARALVKPAWILVVSIWCQRKRDWEMEGLLGLVIGRYPASSSSAGSASEMGVGIGRRNRKCRDLMFLVIFIAF